MWFAVAKFALLLLLSACSEHRGLVPREDRPGGHAGSTGSAQADRGPAVAVGASAGTGTALDARRRPTAGAPASAATGAAGNGEDLRAAPSGDVVEPGAEGEYPKVHFTMDVRVPAGAEMLKCRYAAMPTDIGTIAVPKAESHYTPGSHHFLVYRSDLIGVPADRGNAVFDCPDNVWDHNRGSYYEAQEPNSIRGLPKGVAHVFQPNEVVIIQSHYINPTDKDLDAHAEFILHTMDSAAVEQEAGSILFSNVNIMVPPHSRSRVTMSCPLPQDFNPAMLWSHMHHRASNFIATTDDADAMAELGTTLYAEPDWAEPKAREYPADPPVTLHAGSRITFSCDFNNDTDRTITYGNSAETNEMCILHGMYWPRMTTPGADGCRGGTTKREVLP